MERLGSEGRATFKGGPGCLRGQRLRCSNFNPSFRTKIRKSPIVLSVSLFLQGILGQKLGNARCSSVEVGEVQFQHISTYDHCQTVQTLALKWTIPSRL